MHWGRLEPAFGGNRLRGFCRLDSPAEGVSALALTHFNWMHCACAWTDIRTLHLVRTTTTTTTKVSQLKHVSFVCDRASKTLAGDMADVARTGTAQQWRRERRLRLWLRHERMTVAAEFPQPFITAVMGSRFRALAYGHRRRTALGVDGGQESLRILGRRSWVWSVRHARAPQVCLLFRTSAVVRCTTRLS